MKQRENKERQELMASNGKLGSQVRPRSLFLSSSMGT